MWVNEYGVEVKGVLKEMKSELRKIGMMMCENGDMSMESELAEGEWRNEVYVRYGLLTEEEADRLYEGVCMWMMGVR